MTIKQEPFNLLGKTVLGRASFKPPFKISSALEHEARFVFVVNGQSQLFFPSGQLNLKSGDSIIMKCENFVNHWLENDDGTTNEVIIVHFYPEVLHFVYDEKLPDIFSAKNQTQADPVEIIPKSDMLKNYVVSLRNYLNDATFMSPELLKLKVRELVHVLITSDESGKIKSILSGLFRTNEYEFKEIVHAHIFDELSINDLAFFAGMSLSTFKRKFSAVFGTSPTRYIKSKRLEKAKGLLEKTELRISDIAYDSGFNDIGYFSKSFASTYGFSPSDYRKNYLS